MRCSSFLGLAGPDAVAVLARLQAFVPALAAANAALASQPAPAGVEVEAVPEASAGESESEEEGEEEEEKSEAKGDSTSEERVPHVSMEIACGVLDLHNAAALAAAQAAVEPICAVRRQGADDLSAPRGRIEELK